MIARRLSIDPDLLVSMFSRPDAWRAVANRLPEDAKVDRVDVESQFDRHEDDGVLIRERSWHTIHLWITSSVFSKDDPVNLPAVGFRSEEYEVSESTSNVLCPQCGHVNIADVSRHVFFVKNELALRCRKCKNIWGIPYERSVFDNSSKMSDIKNLVRIQANDDNLWFVARTIAEGYLQQELRRLHQMIDGHSQDSRSR
jgi:hypothetical protein